MTILEASESIQRQRDDTRERYFRSYGIDIRNTNCFDLIVDTGDKTAGEVVALIRKHYRAWKTV
ncbi:MAG: hypothetical protein WBN23_00545 [Woeseia sp.]